MSKIQIDTLIMVIRGYNLAFKATKQNHYRVSRDKAFKTLRSEISSNNLIVKKLHS